MTRHDEIRRAVARALNPQVLDLAAMRERVLGRDEPVAHHIAGSKWGEIVAAFCDAPELGRIIFRLKYAQETPTIPTIERGARLLADRLNGAIDQPAREPSRMFLRMCRQALLEYVHDECPKCTQGRVWGRDAPCVTCGGVGRVARTVAEHIAGWRQDVRVDADPLALHVRCPDCCGGGRVGLDMDVGRQAQGACGICRGTNRRRLTDHQRARQLGLSIEVFTGKSWAQRYEDAVDALAKADDYVAETVDRKLRRGQIIRATAQARSR